MIVRECPNIPPFHQSRIGNKMFLKRMWLRRHIFGVVVRQPYMILVAPNVSSLSVRCDFLLNECILLATAINRQTGE